MQADRIQKEDCIELMRSMARPSTPVRYSRNARVYTTGDSSDNVLYLVEGKVKLAVNSPEGREGMLTLIRPGEIFGWSALSGNAMRETSAVALEDSAALVVPSSGLLDLIQRNAPLAAWIVEVMAAYNARFERAFGEFLVESVEQRMARVLLSLSEGQGNERVLTLVSQESLAAMVGTTQSYVSYWLRRFKEVGLLDKGPWAGVYRLDAGRAAKVLER